MKRAGFAILFACIFSQSYSQFYISGQEPMSTKWKEIKNDSLHIIFPANAESTAKKYSLHQNYAWQTVTTDFNQNPFRLPVILHNKSILSNGFVTWAPKRIELVTTPAMDSDPEPWLRTLAIHETRHAVQMNTLNKGVFRFGSFILGQQSVGIAAGMVPIWFLEGDAVYAETNYSYGGRGRQASFYRQYLAVLAEGNAYSHSKWLLGSYKHHIPNYYSFGYMMIGYTNLKYNSNIWVNAFDRVSKRPYYIFPFRISAKRQFKQSLGKLFNESLTHCDSIWNKFPSDESNIVALNVRSQKDTSDYIQYQYPHLTKDSTIITLKTSLANSHSFILINPLNLEESILFKPGYLTHKPFVNDTLILWSQYRAGLRWEYKNYSEIWSYNIKTKKGERITNKARYFNPILISANQIAAIEVTPKGENYIVVIDLMGNILKAIPVEDGLEVKEITRVDEDRIISRSSTAKGVIVWLHSLTTNTYETVLGPIYRDISNIAYADNSLYFTMTEDYREQLFKHLPKSDSITRVTISPFGISNISLSSAGEIVASLYSSKGSRPCIIHTTDKLEYYSIEKFSKPLFHAKKLSVSSNYSNPKEEEGNLRIQNRSSLKSLFNLHSWAPVYYNPIELVKGNIEIYPGATLISQNLTSTLVSSIGYSYNKTHGLHGHIEWMGWFPKISAGVDYGNTYAWVNGDPLASSFPFNSSELKLTGKITVRLPFTLSSGNVVTTLNIATQYLYENTKVWDYKNELYQNGINTIEPYFSLFSYTRMAHRDIRPRFGTHLFGSFNMVPSKENTLGNIVSTRTTIYLPGLFFNHSLMLNAHFEGHINAQYIRPTRLNPIRGVSEFFGKQHKVVTIDYGLPLLYPDFAIGSLVYLKRVIGNAFYDKAWSQAYISTENGIDISNKTYSSVGIELTCDLHFLRLYNPVRIGYRGGYNLNNSNFFHNFIVGFDISMLYGNNFN